MTDETAKSAANLRFLNARLRDSISGPISVLCAFLAGVASLAIPAIPIWVAMPLGGFIGWVVADICILGPID